METPNEWHEAWPYIIWYWNNSSLVGKALVGLIALMWVDILTGLLAAKRLEQKTGMKLLSSKIGWRGLTKKALTLLGIFIVTVFLSTVPEVVPELQLPARPILLVSTVLWYQLNELHSIIENYSHLGVRIPILSNLSDALRKYLNERG